MNTHEIISYARLIISIGFAIVPNTICKQVREAVRDLDPQHRTPCGGAIVAAGEYKDAFGRDLPASQVLYIERI